MYELSLDRPCWLNGPLARLAKWLRLDRRWLARGSTPDNFDRSLRRLAKKRGLRVCRTSDLSWDFDGTVVTIVEQEEP